MELPRFLYRYIFNAAEHGRSYVKAVAGKRGNRPLHTEREAVGVGEPGKAPVKVELECLRVARVIIGTEGDRPGGHAY